MNSRAVKHEFVESLQNASRARNSPYCRSASTASSGIGSMRTA